jgi:hypothetical protein
MCISTGWALQGLWAAPWLADVENLGPEIVHHLFVMALALCAGALLLGILAERLRRHGVRTQVVLAAVGVLFIAAEPGATTGGFSASFWRPGRWGPKRLKPFWGAPRPRNGRPGAVSRPHWTHFSSVLFFT